MSAANITITIEERLLNKIDELVRSQVYVSRNQVVQVAVQEKIARLSKTRLAQECAKLDPTEEQAFAEEGLAVAASQWPQHSEPLG